MSNAFMTGSHIYGIPGIESDYDLVIFVDDAMLMTHTLGVCPDSTTRMSKDGVYHGKGYSLRFGKLNLLILDDINTYNKWRFCTELCIKIMLTRQQKLTRFEAQSIFQRIVDFDDNPLEVIQELNLLCAGYLTYKGKTDE